MTAGLHRVGHPHEFSIRAFSPSLRRTWIAIAALTVLTELIPFPPIVPPPLFYSYKIAKILLFLILGYCAPLTFWRFNSLTLGVIFAAFRLRWLSVCRAFRTATASVGSS